MISGSSGYNYPGLYNNITAGVFNELAIKTHKGSESALSGAVRLFMSGFGSNQSLYFVNELGSIVQVGAGAGGGGASSILSSSGNSIIASSGSLDFSETNKTYHIRTTNSHLILSSSAGSTITVSGNLNVSGQAYGLVTTLRPSGSNPTQTINWNTGNAQILMLNSASLAVTASLSNPQAGASYVIKVIQHDTSFINVNWPAAVKWPDGIAPTVTTTGSAVDVVSMFYDGTNYYATIGQKFQ